jgi:nucleotide-binding universal stress UspA family protein
MPTRRVTRRILVPLDGSTLDTLTLPHLRALGSVESEILLLHVIPESPETTPGMWRRGPAAQHLREFARTIRDITPYTDVQVRAGTPADQILEVAEEYKVNVIVMASHRRSTPESVFDSVAYRVAQAATVPVMLVHETTTAVPNDAETVARYRRVVVPLDGSSRACAAVPVAVGIAQRQNIPLHIVRAVPTEEEMSHHQEQTTGTPLDHAGYVSHCAEIETLLRDESRMVHACGIDAHASLLIGPPVEAILGVLSPEDILVMSSHGEGGVRPWLLGSIAQKLTTSAPANVVVVPVAERKELTRAIREQAPDASATSETERVTIEHMLERVHSRYGALPRRAPAVS